MTADDKPASPETVVHNLPPELQAISDAIEQFVTLHPHQFAFGAVSLPLEGRPHSTRTIHFGNLGSTTDGFALLGSAIDAVADAAEYWKDMRLMVVATTMRNVLKQLTGQDVESLGRKMEELPAKPKGPQGRN